ncbi:MAG: hypothetical protein QRY74_00615 [Chlamydia sp.]
MTTISNKFSTFFTQNVPDFFHASFLAVSTKAKLCGRGVSNFTRMLHDKTDLQIVNTVLKTHEAIIKLLKSIPSKSCDLVCDAISPLNGPFKDAIQVLNAVGTYTKIGNLFYNKHSWIALPKAILTIFTDVLKHIGVAAKIGLISLRTFNGYIRVKAFNCALNLPTIASIVKIANPLGYLITGLGLAETIRKICKKKDTIFRNVLMLGADTLRGASSILTYLPLGLPGIIANLSMQLFASLLNVVHHYVPQTR